MEELNKMLDTMKKRTEEVFECYAEKDKWNEQDLKCAKEAADLYDKIQNIQMNTGVWEEMQRTGNYSFARVPHISYGDSYGHDQSYARGRDGNTGRYVSRNDMYHNDPYMNQNSYGRPNYGNHVSTHSVKDQAIQRLENLMDTASSEYERQEILTMIKNIENQPR